MTITVPLELVWFVFGAFTMLCMLLILGWWANRRVVQAEATARAEQTARLDDATLETVSALGERLAQEELKAIRRS